MKGMNGPQLHLLALGEQQHLPIARPFPLPEELEAFPGKKDDARLALHFLKPFGLFTGTFVVLYYSQRSIFKSVTLKGDNFRHLHTLTRKYTRNSQQRLDRDDSGPYRQG